MVMAPRLWDRDRHEGNHTDQYWDHATMARGQVASPASPVIVNYW